MEIDLNILWFCIAIVFLVIEIFSFTLWGFFFALGAFVSWLICLIGLTNEFSHTLIIFAISSLVFIVLLRDKMKNITKLKKEKNADDAIGKKVICLEDFNKENKFQGRVEYNGSSWKADSQGKIYKKDEWVEIKERKNITLII